MNKLIKPSGVTFDFESFKKSTVGAGAIILTPTIHLSKRGDFSIYCTDGEGKYNQIRFAKAGDKVGIELLTRAEYNSYSMRSRSTSLTGKISSLGQYLGLDAVFGTDYFSGNFPLYQQDENIWWFDLKEAHSKNKPIKKSLSQRKLDRVKALRGV